MDDDVTTPGAAQLCATLTGARDALDSDAVGEVLARLSGAEVATLMRVADDVAARARAAQVRLTAEAAHRGEFTSARRGVGSVEAWMQEHAPSLRQDGGYHLVRLAQDVASSVPGGLWSTAGPGAGAYADPDKPEGVVWARVVTGEVAPALALTALREMTKLKDVLPEHVAPSTVTKGILDHGVLWGSAAARSLRPHLIARYGEEGEFDDTQRRLRSSAYLTSPRVNDADITEYRLGMTPEQAAHLEAVIGPLSKPAPNEQTGERDLRPAEQRRAEALAAVCAGAASAEGAERRSPGSAPTALHVATTLDALQDALARHTTTHTTTHDSDDSDDTDDDSDTATRSDSHGASTGSRAGRTTTGAHATDPGGRSGRGALEAGRGGMFGLGRDRCGRVLVSRAQLTMLAPAVVRQLACDADIIPVVLGTDGEVLDIGRAVRLFTKGQRRALWHRDQKCTYPGCDLPAGWVQAHHLIHWSDGGPSDLTNAALLCQRHHTLVHDRRLIATVHPPDVDGRCVTWDLTPGSYDAALPSRLSAIRGAQADRRARAERRAAERARLDTGPPDHWLNEPPDEVVQQWVDEWMAELDDRERLDALREAEFDDAIATLLDDERGRTV